MNSFTLKEDKSLKEKYYTKVLSNGMKLIFVPKEFSTAYTYLCCNFGGRDTEYSVGEERFSLPAGAAHFLEHKMFETKDGSDSFLLFDRFGGNANAFTAYSRTCYYFSCTENFFENLQILLDSVSGLYITEASVEKERKIIEREIVMYDDQPSTLVSRNLTKALYAASPALNPIAGTVESISEIDKPLLEQAYRHFYVPSNLSLCVCGNVDIHRVAEMAEKSFCGDGICPQRLNKPEPAAVVSKIIEENAVVGQPLFSFAFKCPPQERDDLASKRASYAKRVAIALTFGRDSDFYCENYALGLVSDRFYPGYSQNEYSAHLAISGSSENPKLLFQKAKEAIKAKQKQGFTQEELTRKKRVAFAESLTLFDSGEDLAAVFAANAFLSYDEYDCIHQISDLTTEEVNNALKDIDTENSAISIVDSLPTSNIA